MPLLTRLSDEIFSLQNTLKNLFGRVASRSRNQRRLNHGVPRACEVQSLEERALLAASIWTQKAADAGHTSYVDTTVTASSIAESWTKTGLTGLADVAIDQDHIYRTATKPGGVGVQYTFEVQALRLSDGGLVWSRAIPWEGSGVSAPSVFNGRVYVSASGHSGGGLILPKLYALNSMSGEILAEQTYESQFGYAHRTVVKDNVLLASDGYVIPGLSAYNASTLTKLWTANRVGSTEPMPVIAGDVAVAYGSSIYQMTTGTRIGGQPAVQGTVQRDSVFSSSGRLLFHGTSTNTNPLVSYVTAVDGKTRQPIWTTQLPPVVAKAAGNGVVAVVSNRSVSILSESTGTVLRTWSSQYPLTNQLALTKTHVFVQSTRTTNATATVHAINISTGVSEWSFTRSTVNQYPQMSIAIGAGRLVVSNFSFMNVFELGDFTPVVVDDYVEAVEDTPILIDVLKNDRARGWATLGSIVSVSAVKGTATLSGGQIRYRPAFNDFGRDQVTYTVRDNFGRESSGLVTIDIASVIDAPVARIKSAVLGVEGRAMAFDASESIDPERGTLTYAWNFGDGSTATGAFVNHTFADNGIYNVQLTVSNGVAKIATRSITINNAAPVLATSSAGPSLIGGPATIQNLTTDAPTDSAALMTYVINWGDGSALETITAGKTLTARHTFNRAGFFDVRTRVTDKDGTPGIERITRVRVVAAMLSNGVLTLGATEAADTIVLRTSTDPDSISATINGQATGVFAGVSQIVVSTQGGNDSVSIQNSIAVPVHADGGSGDDSIDLSKSTAANVVIGGSGKDVLRGGSRRDFLIGGLDQDQLFGGADEDLLMGGVLSLDLSPTGIAPIMAEWTRQDVSYMDRVGRLIGVTPGGLNGSVILRPTNVLDDRSVDEVSDGAGRDVFFGNLTGVLPDLFSPASDELVFSVPNPV